MVPSNARLFSEEKKPSKQINQLELTKEGIPKRTRRLSRVRERVLRTN